LSLARLIRRAFLRHEPGEPIHRAIRHVALCIGEARVGTGTGGAFERARAELRKAAMDGALTLAGRRQLFDRWASTLFSESFTKIPRAYWKTHEITATAISQDNPARAAAHTALTPPLLRHVANAYSDLRVPWDDVLRLWPEQAAGAGTDARDDV
jgi:hypothetical protein